MVQCLVAEHALPQLRDLGLKWRPSWCLTASRTMKLVDLLKNVALGASAGVALLTVLPIFGAVGTLTVTGQIVGSVAGGAAGLLDTLRKGRT